MRLRFHREQTDYFVLQAFPPTIGIGNWVTTLLNFGIAALFIGVILGVGCALSYQIVATLVGERLLGKDDLKDAWRSPDSETEGSAAL